MGAILFDLRYVTRVLRKSPAFVLIAVFTLAVGIGATTAMFSVVNAVLLRLPFRDAERLVRFTTFDTVHRTAGEVSYVDVQNWRLGNRTFEAIAAIGSTNWPVTLKGDEPIAIAYAPVSGNFFDILGSTALLGRTLTMQDDVPGADRVVVISYALWHGRFAGNPSIVGRPIRLSGGDAAGGGDVAFTVVGVMPPVFRYPAGAMLWAPISPALVDAGSQLDLLHTRGVLFLHAVGRLKPAVSLAQAEGDLGGLLHDDLRNNARVRATPIVDDYFGRVRWALIAALGSVFLLLVIACSSVAGLLVARVARRQREWAVRRAVGARRADITRLAALETAGLALMGSAAGLAATPALIRAIEAVDPTGFLADYPIHIDLRVAAIAFGATVVALAVGTAAPTLQALKLSDTESMSLALRHRVSIARLRRWLVVAQVSVTTTLLVGALLMTRSVINLAQIDLGFEPRHLLLVNNGSPRGLSRGAYDAWTGEFIADLRAINGVVHAAGVYEAPLQGPIGFDSPVLAEGEPLVQASWDRHPPTNAECVTSDYFATMGIRLLAGRVFTADDRGDAPLVAIISESLARQMWPGQNAVGKRLLNRFVRPTRDDRPLWATVVGVVADVRYREIERSRLDLYLPLTQAYGGTNDIVIRTAGDPLAIAPAVRATLRRRNPSAVVHIRTMASLVADATSAWRLTLTIVGAFAVFALLLSATGLFGFLAYMTEERTHEIGIRVALGAASRQVCRLMVANAAGLVSIGLAAGVGVSMALSRILRMLVFEVSPTDPIVLSVAVLVLLAVAIAASYVPVRRATNVDPMVTLRAE